jgi:hypothetical protein
MYTEVQIIFGSNLQTKRKNKECDIEPQRMHFTRGCITSKNTLHRECMAPENLYKFTEYVVYLPVLVENPVNALLPPFLTRVEPHQNSQVTKSNKVKKQMKMRPKGQLRGA